MDAERREVRITFPEYIQKIISRLGDAGYDAYAVGGCIRDSVLGRVPNDWDVTTAADPHETMRIFAEGDIHVIGTAGIRHGTIMVKAGDDVCEITTFRCDGDYKDHRRPDSVSFSKNIEEDLARRDFTMNAVAAKPGADGCVLVDPFGGIDDIGKRVIRTVGDPRKRFTEDALRILRAVRFTSELGFSVDTGTVCAASELVETLGYVSKERITAELWKTLSGEYLGCAVTAFADVFEYLAGGDCERFLKNAASADDPYVRLALMMKHGTDGSSFFERMRFPTKTVSLVRSLLNIGDVSNDTADVCKLMGEFDEGIGCAVKYLSIIKGKKYGDALAEKVDEIMGNDIPYKLSMLDITGREIGGLGIVGGEIGDALEWMLSSVQNGDVQNERTALLEAFKEKKNQK